MPVIAFTTRKGGSGKTTLATAVAGYLASGLPTAIIDLDPQASASAWAASRAAERPKVTAIRSKPAALKDDVARLLGSGTQVVVIDTPPHSDACLAGAVDVADCVVLPSLPSAFDLHALASAIEAVKAKGKPAGVVLNSVIPHTRAVPEAEAAVAAMGMPLLATVSRRMAWQYAAARGMSPAELEPKGEAARELDALCAAIVGLLERNQ